VLFLNRGRLAGSGTVDEFAQPDRENTLFVESLAEADQAELRVWLARRGARLRTGAVGRRGSLERAYLAAVRGGRSDEA
jgi:hypothetical protein